MSPARLVLTLAVGLATTCTALAHSELHSAQWCANGVVRYRGTFTITSAQLNSEFNRRYNRRQICLQEAGLPDRTPEGDSTCGIFDPPYEVAAAMARAACGAPDSPVPTADSPVVAIVLSPQSFNDPDHHASFNLDDDISVSCGVCWTNATAISNPATRVPLDSN
jgi:hypothetical protein